MDTTIRVKNEENQSFTTFDTVSVLGLLVGVFLIVVSIVSNAMVDQRPEQARLKAKRLAKQILLGGYQSPNAVLEGLGQNYSRYVATVPKLEIRPNGRIGLDPWGSPYYYRVINDNQDRTKVVVLSAGPDRILSTSEELLRADARTDMSRKDVVGDDLAEILF